MILEVIRPWRNKLSLSFSALTSKCYKTCSSIYFPHRVSAQRLKESKCVCLSSSPSSTWPSASATTSQEVRFSNVSQSTLILFRIFLTLGNLCRYNSARSCAYAPRTYGCGYRPYYGYGYGCGCYRPPTRCASSRSTVNDCIYEPGCHQRIVIPKKPCRTPSKTKRVSLRDGDYGKRILIIRDWLKPGASPDINATVHYRNLNSECQFTGCVGTCYCNYKRRRISC